MYNSTLSEPFGHPGPLGKTCYRPFVTRHPLDWFVILFAIFCIVLAPGANAAELKIAAAADLKFVFEDLTAGFQRESGDVVRVTYGSSGNFFSQIQNGAPFDLFFSADVGYPEKLEAAGLTAPNSIYEYARGELVIWVPNSSRLDLKQGLAVLLDPGVQKISIANPTHAPYGAAAVAAMKHAGIYEKVRNKLVQGENISQAAQFVQSGNAEVGIVALSLALAPSMKAAGRFVRVPLTDYPPLIQAAVILKSSREEPLAKRFLNFVKRPESGKLMERYGFVVPQRSASSHD